MWYVAAGPAGRHQPESEEVRELARPLPEGKRVLSHVGTVDIIYELVCSGWRCLLVAFAAAVIAAGVLRSAGSVSARL